MRGHSTQIPRPAVILVGVFLFASVVTKVSRAPSTRPYQKKISAAQYKITWPFMMDDLLLYCADFHGKSIVVTPPDYTDYNLTAPSEYAKASGWPSYTQIVKPDMDAAILLIWG